MRLTQSSPPTSSPDGAGGALKASPDTGPDMSCVQCFSTLYSGPQYSPYTLGPSLLVLTVARMSSGLSFKEAL